MLKEILVVSGKPGLYRLISKGSNLLVIESLADKKRIPAYSRDKVISLGDVSIYTDGDEAVSIREVFASIQKKKSEDTGTLDIAKAQPDELRAYFAEILPNFDRDRVYPTDIKKILKWYDMLIANGITDFSAKEEEQATEESGASTQTAEETPTKTASSGTSKPATRHKDSVIASAKSVKSSKTGSPKPAAKTATPKKNIVGAKRGG